ncbi:MAG: DUF5723 family protein [Bacteroidota bacterium]
MKKTLLIWCFVLVTANLFGQQFAQYNTGSLYDSFENPAQRAFIPDTTRQFAFNFFIPNFSNNFYIAGNAQQGVKSRIFSSYYNTANLKTDEDAFNRVNINFNAYAFMFKVFASENGDQEVGVFYNTKGEARAFATDETLAIFNGFNNFAGNSYSNVLNDNFRYQLYHQIGFTYREQVSRNFAFGIKLSALSGIGFRETNITQSSLTFDRTAGAETATISLEGNSRANGTTNASAFQKIGPSFLNPGAAISVGTMITDDLGYKWQVNLKDFGFIHWNKSSKNSAFGGTSIITGYLGADRESAITNGTNDLTTGNQTEGAFTTHTNGLLELSVNKSYWLDANERFKFSPTLIASKELMYSGFTAALVAPVQMGKYSATLMSSYNDLKLLNFGAQFMIKKENSEFFIGTEQLFQTVSFANTAVNPPVKRQIAVNQGSHSGFGFYIGASFKFGYLIERRLNSSFIPDGDNRGLIGRTWDKLFGKKDPNYN